MKRWNFSLRACLYAVLSMSLSGIMLGNETERDAENNTLNPKNNIETVKNQEDITVAVYYFGNYHLDPRNEKRLGDGWTEWELVKKAKPRFEGHAQPKVPLWGYTDEANPRDMAQKIDAAANHGVDVFLFDWYYYNDGPFLNRTIDEGFLKAENRDKIQFALMWANHDWVELFPKKKDIPSALIYPGTVTPEMFDEICDHIIRDYFSQPNYWKIDGKPYFSFYELTKLGQNFGSFEATKAALARFREKAKAAGFSDIHLNAVYWGYPNIPGEGTVAAPIQLIEELGFDSVTSYVWIHHVGLPEQVTDFNWVRDAYFQHWDKAREGFQIPYIPNVSMGWDSSPRACQDDPFGPFGYPFTNIIGNNTPENFRRALELTRDRMLADPKCPRIMNINSWNEWTEGSYIEPDTEYGYQYLEAIRDVFGK
ncbi:MAG: glycoside hydrolase family 99-like domain-containing protein [Planctomycetia bacterium]|nr:glycoside hydrolase family 99-like domain-containing protein [Planctomycetia bacterium]